MEINRFGLGFRFPLGGDMDENWNLLFDAFPYADLIGAELACCEPKRDEVFPQKTLLYVISNLSRGRACRIFETTRRSAKLLCAMPLYRPVMQANYLTRCERTHFLGTVDKSGQVRGGDASFGQMQFSHRDIPPVVDIIPARMLIVGAPYQGAPAADVCRAFALELQKRLPLATPLMLPVSNCGTGLVDAIVTGLCGRYRSVTLADGVQSYIGVLPDYSAVIDESYQGGKVCDASALGQKAAFAIQAGCKALAVAADTAIDTDGGAGFVSALEEALAGTVPGDATWMFLHPDWDKERAYPALNGLKNVSHTHELAAVLSLVSADKKLTDISHVIWAVESAGESDRHERMRMEKLAKQLLKRFLTAPMDDEKPLCDIAAEKMRQLASNLWI